MKKTNTTTMRVWRQVWEFARNDDGVELAEFALVMALLSIASLAAMTYFGTNATHRVQGRQAALSATASSTAVH